jgi:hypothetical protein
VVNVSFIAKGKGVCQMTGKRGKVYRVTFEKGAKNKLLSMKGIEQLLALELPDEPEAAEAERNGQEAEHAT